MINRGVSVLAQLVALVALAACARDRAYRVPNWQEVRDGQRLYEAEIHSGVRARVSGAGAEGTFGVTLELFNKSPERMSFDGTAMELADANLTALPARIAERKQCQASVPTPTEVPSGGYLKIQCGWSADLRKMPDYLALLQKGVTVGGRPVEIAISMVD